MRRSAIRSGLFLFTAALGLGEAWAGPGSPLAPATATGGPRRGPAAPVGPGDAAIDFTLADASGASHSLDDYRGKLVLLWFLGYG